MEAAAGGAALEVALAEPATCGCVATAGSATGGTEPVSHPSRTRQTLPSIPGRTPPSIVVIFMVVSPGRCRVRSRNCARHKTTAREEQSGGAVSVGKEDARTFSAALFVGRPPLHGGPSASPLLPYFARGSRRSPRDRSNPAAPEGAKAPMLMPRTPAAVYRPMGLALGSVTPKDAQGWFGRCGYRTNPARAPPSAGSCFNLRTVVCRGSVGALCLGTPSPPMRSRRCPAPPRRRWSFAGEASSTSP